MLRITFHLIVKSLSRPIPIILAISRKITQKIATFTRKITKNRIHFHSQISQFPQIVKHEIMFMLDSRKFWSQLISIRHPILTLLLDTYSSADLLGSWSFVSGQVPKFGHQFDEMDFITYILGKHTFPYQCCQHLLVKLRKYIVWKIDSPCQLLRSKLVTLISFVLPSENRPFFHLHHTKIKVLIWLYIYLMGILQHQ